MIRTIAATAVLATVGATPAFAHLDPAETGSFMAGFTHPFFGTDHVLAIVAVGLWAALLGGKALWLVPAAFVAIMVAGFLAALGGLVLPSVEPVILASVVVIGLLTATALRLPLPAAMAIVGFFAIFHGHAHGSEIGMVEAGPYALGFAIATAVLHAVGAGLGQSSGKAVGRTIIRAAGAATALGGIWLAIA